MHRLQLGTRTLMTSVKTSLPPAPSHNKRGNSPDSPPHPKDRKRRRVDLRIEIPPLSSMLEQAWHNAQKGSLPSPLSRDSSDLDSLFDEISSSPSLSSLEPPTTRAPIVSASRYAPPIPGIYFDPLIQLPQHLADRVVHQCMSTYFNDPDTNQVMLFGRAPSIETPSALFTTSFPPVLNELLSSLAITLRQYLPEPLYTLLFPPSPERARQAIINLYRPGEGISKHVDLLRRFGDGIIGVSFGSGCVMQFERVAQESSASNPASVDDSKDKHDLYLPERSIIVLSEEARYKWTHGIERRLEDTVEGTTIARGTRMSITFRWLLPGAEILGDTDGSAPSP